MVMVADSANTAGVAEISLRGMGTDRPTDQLDKTYHYHRPSCIPTAATAARWELRSQSAACLVNLRWTRIV